MPLALTVYAERRPRFTDRASRVPAWRRLHAVADEAFPGLRTLWSVVFSDLKDALDFEALRAALASGNLLAVESVIAPALAQADAVARGTLPTLVRQAVERAAETITPALRTMLGVGITVRFNVVNEASVQWIEEYAGTQVRDISATTRESIRGIVRRQFTEGRSITEVMRDLESHIGLTPRQAQAVDAFRARLVDAGTPAGQVTRLAEAAARQALRLRVEAIARTESITASLAGQDRLWHTAADQGFLDREQFRRFWVVTPDDRLCTKRCKPIPSMNPQGVALDQPFQTPIGPVMFPAAHPLCRCAVNGVATP